MKATYVRGFLPALFALSMLGVGCRNAANNGGNNTNNVTSGRDGGTQITTCTTSQDCVGGVCVGGICQQVSACQSDEDCAAEGQVCHQTRFYCVECDDRAGQCSDNEYCTPSYECAPYPTQPDAGVSECSGTCATRDDCDVDKVCSEGSCCPPPSRCRSPNDCPAATPECNGATGQCFGGSGCFQDSDCEQEAACTGGRCFCDIQGAPPGVCAQRPDECTTDADCYDAMSNFVGKFCTVANPPRRCADAPTCASDADCAAFGLVCDTDTNSPSNGYCQNGMPCPNGDECGAGQVCEGGVCVTENCINNPGLCGANETCDTATGACVPTQGGSCTLDTDCQAGYYCNTTSSTCEVGCRDNTECPGGVCNAAHQCEYPTGQFCGPCTTDADCPGGALCKDPLGLGSKCYEQCSTLLNQPCSDPSASCILTTCSCF